MDKVTKVLERIKLEMVDYCIDWEELVEALTQAIKDRKAISEAGVLKPSDFVTKRENKPIFSSDDLHLMALDVCNGHRPLITKLNLEISELKDIIKHGKSCKFCGKIDDKDLKIAELQEDVQYKTDVACELKLKVAEQSKTIENLSHSSTMQRNELQQEQLIGQGDWIDELKAEVKAQAERIKLLELANSNANHLIEEEIGLKTKLQAEVAKLKEQIEELKKTNGRCVSTAVSSNSKLECEIARLRKLLDRERVREILIKDFCKQKSIGLVNNGCRSNGGYLQCANWYECNFKKDTFDQAATAILNEGGEGEKT